MSHRRLILLPLALLSWRGTVRAGSPSTPPEIITAIRQLDDDTYIKREQAMQFLWEAGPAAEPALKAAVVHGDPEVRARAEQVLEKFHRGIYPGTPPDVAALAGEYPLADVNRRAAIIGGLGSRGGYGMLVLSRLAAEETDAGLNEKIRITFAVRASTIGETATILLTLHQPDAAGRMLEQAVTTTGDETAVRAYGAFLLATGTLKDKMAAKEASVGNPPDPRLASKLAFFHRAAGDLAEAQVWADRSGDARLIESLQLERRDWPALARSLAASSQGTEDVRRVGLLAAVQQFAGDQPGFTASLARLRLLRKRADIQDQVATAFLLNGQVDEALGIYLDRKAYLTAFEFYRETSRFPEALALVDRAIVENHPDAFKLRALSARLLWRLGERDKARAFVDAAGAENEQRKDLDQFVNLWEAEKEMGQPQQARAYAAAALAIAREQDYLGWLCGRLFPGKGPAATRWWVYLRSRPKPLPVAEEFERLTALLNNRLPAAEVEALVTDAGEANDRARQPAYDEWLPLLADALKGVGREQAAQKYLDQLIEERKRRGEWAGAGDLLAAKKDWAAAADAWQHFVVDGVPLPQVLWLRGDALVRAGRPAEGAAAMLEAKSLPLADGDSRRTLADVMTAHGSADDAREQCELILRTTIPRGLTFYNAATKLGNDASARGDYLKASQYWEWYLLTVLDSNGEFTTPTWYLNPPRIIHHARARALVARGDAAGAMAELRAYLTVSGAEAQLAIDFVPALDKIGHRAEADELFAVVLKRLQKVCDDFPRGAHDHNELAWCCTLCDREPDLALAHARTAVDLAPTNTANLDTLAEVHFRAGRLAEAEAAMKKCIELEPNQDRHRKRLEAFKAGKGFSQ